MIRPEDARMIREACPPLPWQAAWPDEDPTIGNPYPEGSAEAIAWDQDAPDDERRTPIVRPMMMTDVERDDFDLR